MADGRGGARRGAGRKSKAEEMGLAKLLDECFTLADRREVFTSLAELAKGRDMKAIELLLAYTYGKPVQRQEHSGQVGTYTVDLSETDDSSSQTDD